MERRRTFPTGRRFQYDLPHKHRAQRSDQNERDDTSLHNLADVLRHNSFIRCPFHVTDYNSDRTTALRLIQW